MARKIRSDLEGVVSAYRDGDAITLKAGDEVPEGVEVGDHLFDDGAETESGDDGGQGADELPKGNASREEWAKYADDHGVAYEAEAKREDIKAAIEQAAAEQAAAEGAGA